MAEDCGPWLEKKLEIGKYSKPNKLCGLCEVRRPAVPPSLLSPPFPRAPTRSLANSLTHVPRAREKTQKFRRKQPPGPSR